MAIKFRTYMTYEMTRYKTDSNTQRIRASKYVKDLAP